ncbi:MAG: hypothetical protein QOD11_2067 [Bradyrhizobium sp.]|jgi:hypothetical protein|nr:hypothetical protein [Bradyrhizobium sp.]
MSVDDAFDDLERRMSALVEEETQKAMVGSFSNEQLVDHLHGADMTNSFIRGHLYFEHILVEAITGALTNPFEIDLRRLSFPAKLDLALALGVLPLEFRRIGNVLNEMRNKVAHRLDFEFGDEHQRLLWNALPDVIRANLLKHKSLPADRFLEIHIHSVLVALLSAAEGFRRRAAIGRARNRVADQHLREAVELARPGMEARGLLKKR